MLPWFRLGELVANANDRMTADEFAEAQRITSHTLAFLHEHYPDRPARVGLLAAYMTLSSIAEASEQKL